MSGVSSSIFWRLELLHCSSCQAPCDLSKYLLLTPSSPWSVAFRYYSVDIASPGNTLPIPDLSCLDIHEKMVALALIHKHHPLSEINQNEKSSVFIENFIKTDIRE